MSFSEKVRSALEEYQNKRGIWRRLFSFFGFGKAPAIKALYRLSPDYQTNTFQIVRCFIKNMPNKSQASYQVYEAVMHDHFGFIEKAVLDKLTDNLTILHEADLLTQENFAIITAPGDLYVIANALVSLLSANSILTQENFAIIKSHVDPERVANALVALNDNFILTPENREAVLSHASPKVFATALVTLNSAELLTPENREAVLSHASLEVISSALYLLNGARILTQENFAVITAHADPEAICDVLSRLNSAGILLTQANFDRLLDPNNNFLLSSRMEQQVWSRVPAYLMTQDLFNQFVEFAQDTNPGQLMLMHVLTLLHQPANQEELNFNNSQSTHTESIHESTSTSAKKLWQRYEKKLRDDQLEKIITEVQDEILSLEVSRESTAAKHCIRKISAKEYNYTDPNSKVTTRQLLALCYLAINDKENRSGSLEDAKQLFINGLYEIQRGYNLSAEGIDDGLTDKPICAAGTFNKLIEKLSGIHPDVELIFINKETATLKLPIVVREEANNHLNELSSSEKLNNPVLLGTFINIINQLKEEGIEVIWQSIQPKVADRLFDEFSSLFVNRQDPKFLSFVANGMYAELEDLSIYEQRISARKYDECRNTPQPSKGFFSMQQTPTSNPAESADRRSFGK